MVRVLGYGLSGLRAGVIPLCTAVMIAGLLLLNALAPRGRARWAARFRRHWAMMTCTLLGLRLEVSGQPHPSPCLYVANHRSWADAPVLLALLRCTLLSKAEVADYPIIGVGAQAVGIAFVARTRLRSRGAALAGLQQTLAQGQSVGLFAEGTTSHWGELRPLEGGAFRVAAAGYPLVPVAVSYEHPSDSWGDESLAQHFFRRMGRWQQRVRVVIGPTLEASTPTHLRHETAEWLRQTLHRLEPAAESRAASR